MMQDAIKDFPKQFAYKPIIENENNLVRKDKVIVIGMGGSHLAGDMVSRLASEMPVRVYNDYGLPQLPEKELEDSLIICSSYSGNTEEVLSAYDEARRKGLSVVAIAVGEQLIENAKRDGIPYVQIPDTGIQPRSALGFSLMGHLKLLGREDLLTELSFLASLLDSTKIEKDGKALAERMKDCVPVIYCSRKNWTLAWNWKIKLNETGKIPAFYNIFPELNHNEMNGFDVQESTKFLSKNFYFLILKDNNDHPKIKKRMEITEKLYRNKGLAVETIELEGKTDAEKLFSSLILADWTAVYTAELYGLESEQVPMVEEFKGMIKE
ncbi:MAG: bifunctional phosphoglucose/phosphomannose isomerase [Candidatus Magasanikbacteria bacterium CG_4_10_14_0_2_um_filter_37_12]|uniref:Bifunctional phosphoglucose/phosphomannose isomerase n=1 Tax=Candidatus Magasanikbacteria bacterium CG_4_10_14_0_2_um_filter_37_12 TaxID=1974637 RepID=A0A2M7V9P4_9BACT|nr:MAG: bifunctional phosphoglucose/phosphomannose isomerase [Candidatus Magasanikbacteria bacterium CG_4_10_14_0_2_um_filter_37_12]